MNNTLLNAEGKVLLAFGAAGGIGSATVDAFTLAGGQAMAADVKLISSGVRCDFVHCDVADKSSIEEAVAKTHSRFGRLDAVVHCVGVLGSGPLVEVDLYDWHRIMNVNLTSAFLIARATWPHLRATCGSLVFVASTSGLNGGTTATGPAYAASKAGMINLMRYLAKEWAPDNIRVNAVAPGPVMTPLVAAMPADRRDAYAQSVLTRRFIEPDEIGAAIAFLLSEHARSITGATLNQSAGLVLG